MHQDLVLTQKNLNNQCGAMNIYCTATNHNPQLMHTQYGKHFLFKPFKLYCSRNHDILQWHLLALIRISNTEWKHQRTD